MLMEHQKEYRTTYLADAKTAIKDTPKGNTGFINNQVEKRNAIFRTCRELLLADPSSLKSGMYWIDPDGQGVGDDPITSNAT